MSRNDAFYLEEYKSLRQEIDAKLRGRLDFNRWGLIGLAALYSYILSHPGKPVLFWVPVCLSLAMLAHLNEEHSMVAKAGTYIKEQLEPWARSGDQIPRGWEKYLEDTNTPFWCRWPWHLWGWSPVPLWVSVLGLTLLIAIGVSVGLWPSLVEPPVSCSS
jgi:hypothetical protein